MLEKIFYQSHFQPRQERSITDMTNIIRNTTGFAMHIIKEYITPDSIVVDATCGNGHDTLHLAQCGPKRLYAFDLQEQAVASTRDLLVSEGLSEALASGRIKLICASHSDIDAYISSPIDVAVFNLGYLPGSDKAVTTRSGTTSAALSCCLDRLSTGGLVCMTMYSGHPGGREEKEELLETAEALDPGIYHCAYISMINQPSDPPEILLITRKKR